MIESGLFRFHIKLIVFNILRRNFKMAVKIRLRRIGEKKAPFYRIIVADSRSPRNGRFIDEIGTYDPSTDPSTFNIDEEAAKKWIANGAQPTEVVGKLFKVAGIIK
jgi:small subunit ribosomal protein S16